MGDWYWIGLLAGLGTAFGILFAGFLGGTRAGAVAAAVLGAGAGLLAGLAIGEWDEAIGGAIGGVLGAAGATQVIGGALRRGGTRVGTAILVAAAAVVVGVLALIPIVGYLEAVAAPLVGARLRRRTPERYAGLRSLAK
jgi:hypothetical protein